MKTKSLSLSQLSIKEFAVSDTAHSGNFGIVELLILHACDRAIFSKQKWILSMDMYIASKSRAKDVGADLNRDISIVLETPEGIETFNVPDSSSISSISMQEVERTLNLSVSVFSQQLWKYNVMQGTLRSTNTRSNPFSNSPTPKPRLPAILASKFIHPYKK
jgi:hypothetical protein